MGWIAHLVVRMIHGQCVEWIDTEVKVVSVIVVLELGKRS